MKENQKKIEQIFDNMIDRLLNETETCDCAIPSMLVSLAFSITEAQQCVPYCSAVEKLKAEFAQSDKYFMARHMQSND